MPADPGDDARFAEREHPQKAEMHRVREVMLGADERLTETIKWQSPTFVYEGNLASIDPHAKKHVSVLFHRGAEIPGDHPALEGGGKLARYIRYADLDAVEAGRPALEAIVRAWCDSRR
jgi:hypothetical protein